MCLDSRHLYMVSERVLGIHKFVSVDDEAIANVVR